MSARDMDDVRKKVVIPAKEWVRLTIEFLPDPDSGEFTPFTLLECRSCDARLAWYEKDSWWKCANCEMELTPVELFNFFGDCAKALDMGIRSEEPVKDGAMTSMEGNFGRWAKERAEQFLKNAKDEMALRSEGALQRLRTLLRNK